MMGVHYGRKTYSNAAREVDVRISETLLVLFKSAPIQALMKKWCSGTILTAISKSSLEKIPLPKIALPDQQKIATDIQDSFSLRHQSEQLFIFAKQAVEMAIEYNEYAAIKWRNERA
jgi:restriction endonuclease S subunit